MLCKWTYLAASILFLPYFLDILPNTTLKMITNRIKFICNVKNNVVELLVKGDEIKSRREVTSN